MGITAPDPKQMWYETHDVKEYPTSPPEYLAEAQELLWLDDLPTAAGLQGATDPLHRRMPIKPSHADWKAATNARTETPCFPRPCANTASRLEELKAAFAERRAAPNEGYFRDVLPARVQQSLRPESEFRAGALNASADVWDSYLRWVGAPQDQTTEVVKMLREGVALERCHPLDDYKVKETHHQKRVEGVRIMLQQAGYAPDVAASMLTAAEPESAIMPNRFSCQEHEEFARAQIATNVQRGALIKWPWSHLRPWIISPLSVVVNSGGKLRLIMDARFLNLFLQRKPFKYETAVDVLRLLHGKTHVWTLDFTAGYHHVLLRPEDWTYCGLQFDGQLYVHAALPFGMSQSPEVFTRIVQLGYLGLRANGEALTGMIDDSLGAAESEQTAAQEMGTQMRVLDSLGWCLSARKCMRAPASVAEYLGFRFDTKEKLVSVPQSKVERLLLALQELSTTWSEKLHRTVAGKLASMSLALPFSSLLVRALRYEAAGEPQEPILDAGLKQFLQQHLTQLNGRPWDAQLRPAAVLVVDTSDTATGAFIQDSTWTAVFPFDASDLARMQQGTFSSTEREVLGILRAVEEVGRTGFLEAGVSRALQVICDNQGAVSALTHMRGGPAIFPLVAKVHLLALKTNLVLSFAWRPRTTTEVRKADYLSKVVDYDDWWLSRTVLNAQVGAQGKYWAERGFWPPHCDLFGSQGAHVVSRYFSREWDGQSVGQDAMSKAWAAWPSGLRAETSKDRPVMYAFPPVHLLPVVLMKIQVEQPNIWLVCTRFLREADEMFVRRLPVKCRFNVRCRDTSAIVRPTRRNPAWRKGEKWYTPLQIMLIIWDSTEP